MSPDLQRHAIAGVADIITSNGLPAVHIKNGSVSGLIYLHGAHVAAWNPGTGEVLWMSGKSMFEAAKPIRGGVPICFPWFGPRQNAPGHGFVRLEAWQLESIRQSPAGVTVTLATLANDSTRNYWPHDFILRHSVTFGATLTMALELSNIGTASFTAEEALHTYFTLGDVRHIHVEGLTATRYLDKMDNATEKTQDGDITITGETDRVYLDTRAPVVIADPMLKRRIIVSKENSLATVVWNPWVAKSKAMPDFGDDEWPGMICVETCNVGVHAVTLAPGQTHLMSAKIAVEPL